MKLFNSRIEAVALEIKLHKKFDVKLHKKFDVKLHEKFYNKANQTSTKFDTTGLIPWNKGRKDLGGYKHTKKRRPWTEEEKKNLSTKMIGHKKSNTVNYKGMNKGKMLVVDENGNNLKIDKLDWDKNKYTSINEEHNHEY